MTRQAEHRLRLQALGRVGNPFCVSCGGLRERRGGAVCLSCRTWASHVMAWTSRLAFHLVKAGA